VFQQQVGEYFDAWEKSRASFCCYIRKEPS
jgi:hypothetical protein